MSSSCRQQASRVGIPSWAYRKSKYCMYPANRSQPGWPNQVQECPPTHECPKAPYLPQRTRVQCLVVVSCRSPPPALSVRLRGRGVGWDDPAGACVPLTNYYYCLCCPVFLITIFTHMHCPVFRLTRTSVDRFDTSTRTCTSSAERTRYIQCSYIPGIYLHP